MIKQTVTKNKSIKRGNAVTWIIGDRNRKAFAEGVDLFETLRIFYCDMHNVSFKKFSNDDSQIHLSDESEFEKYMSIIYGYSKYWKAEVVVMENMKINGKDFGGYVIKNGILKGTIPKDMMVASGQNIESLKFKLNYKQCNSLN